jgi:hypothetical protein
MTISRSHLARFREVLGVFAFVMACALAAAVRPAYAADPNTGPGGPILVVTSSTATFSKYYAEILRTEGLNAFAVADVSTLTAALNPDTVLLTRRPDNTQVTRSCAGLSLRRSRAQLSRSRCDVAGTTSERLRSSTRATPSAAASSTRRSSTTGRPRSIR